MLTSPMSDRLQKMNVSPLLLNQSHPAAAWMPVVHWISV